MSISHAIDRASTVFAARMGVPRELQIALNAPLGPQRLAADTVVIDRDGWYRTLTPSSQWPGANEVLFSNLDESGADEQIDALVSEYHGAGLPISWCVYPWSRPWDLGKRLASRGASKSPIHALLGSTGSRLDMVEGLEVQQVDPELDADYDLFIETMAAGFGLPPEEREHRRGRYRELGTGPDPCLRLFLARYKGAVAGCQALVVKLDSGHMTGAYVVPEFRAYGVFQTLISAALKVLRDLGIQLATGHSNEQSAFWAERFGFKMIYSYDIYQLDPP